MTRRRRQTDQPRGDVQLGLDYEGPFRDRMSSLRARLGVLTEEATGLTGARLENLRQCLLAVYAHAGASPERYAQASPDDLHATAELSRSVFSRARRDACRLGLLRAERPRVRRGQKRPPDRLWLEHGPIEALVAACREEAAERRSPRQSPERRQRARDGLGSGGISRDQVGSAGISRDHNKETHVPSFPQSQTPLPSPSSAAVERRAGACGLGASGSDALGGWVEDLIRLGVLRTNATASIEAFVGSGGGGEDLRSLLAVYRSRPGAWGPGAIVTRLKRWAIGQDPAEHWPPVSDDWERRERQKRRGDELAAAAACRESAKREREHAADGRSGSADRWRALSDEERRRLLDERLPNWRGMRLPADSVLLSCVLQGDDHE